MRWGRRNRAGGSQPEVWLAGPSMTKNTPSSAQRLGVQCSLPNVPLVSWNTWSWRRTALSVSLCLRSVISCLEMMWFHSASWALKHCELLVLGTETGSEKNVYFHLFLEVLKSHSVDVQLFLSMGHWGICFKPFYQLCKSWSTLTGTYPGNFPFFWKTSVISFPLFLRCWCQGFPNPDIFIITSQMGAFLLQQCWYGNDFSPDHQFYVAAWWLQWPSVPPRILVPGHSMISILSRCVLFSQGTWQFFVLKPVFWKRWHLILHTDTEVTMETLNLFQLPTILLNVF